MKRYMSGSWMNANKMNAVRDFDVPVFRMSREA